jgi:hypothetical protein
MFRFTIREMVLLTIIVAIGVGWWLDRRALTAQMARLKSNLFLDRAIDVIEMPVPIEN